MEQRFKILAHFLSKSSNEKWKTLKGIRNVDSVDTYLLFKLNFNQDFGQDFFPIESGPVF